MNTRISWLELPERIKYELQQQEEEGNNVAELRKKWDQILNLNLGEEKFRRKAVEFYSKLEENFPVCYR